MKTENMVFAILWVAMSGAPQVSQADDKAAMQGVMDVIKTMQQQSGSNADPGSKAIMDILGNTLSEGDDRPSRQGNRSEQRRKPSGYDDDDDRRNRQGNRSEQRRKPSGYDDDDRPNRQGDNRSEQRRRPSGDDDSERRGERRRGESTSADSGRQRRNQD